MEGYIEVYPGCFVLPETAEKIRKHWEVEKAYSAILSAYRDEQFYNYSYCDRQEEVNLLGEELETISKLRKELTF